MNFCPFNSISIYDNSATKAAFPLQNETLPSSSSLNSFSSEQLSNSLNLSMENQTYKIRKSKSLAISSSITQSPLPEEVLSTLNYISRNLSDSALLDFCEFFSFCYKIVPREVISRIISVFQIHQFTANSLIVISYIIKDFQDNPYDENSAQFFQSFINNSFSQLRKELLSSTVNNSNIMTAPNSTNNSDFFNLEKISNCFSFCIVDSQNLFDQEDDFDDSSLFLDNHNYNDVIENDDIASNRHSINSNSTFAQNNSFLDPNSNTDTENNTDQSSISNFQRTYKLFDCDFTFEKILRFLLYLLRSKEMQEISPMCNNWTDFADILASQYESRTELAQFADYMISIGKINMVPKEMFMNSNFIELAHKKNIIEILKILSVDDLNNNILLFATLLNHFRESEFATVFLKRCQYLDYTLPPLFMKEIIKTSKESPQNENDTEFYDEYIFSEIVNRIDPNEFSIDFLNYLSRYRFKLNSKTSRCLESIIGPNIYNPSNISLEYLIQIIDLPLMNLNSKFLIPYLYTCTNPNVFNSLTNNYPNGNQILMHPLFQDPKFWSQLISTFEFNSIHHFANLFISNNTQTDRGPLIAKIFLVDFPNNMKSSFYFFAKIALADCRDIFSTCKETRELLSRFAYFYPRQFWRLFSKTNLIVDFARSLQGRFTYNYMILALSLVQINIFEERGISLGDPLIKDFYLPSPPTSNLIEEIINFFKTSDNFFKIENASNEAIQVISVGHYYFSALIFHYTPFTINGYNPLYCIILFIIIINDLKYFKKAGFEQNKKTVNSLLNTPRNINMLKKVFEMDFSGKDQLIDLFLSSFGSQTDDTYVLNINDSDLLWVKYIFENDFYLQPNLSYSNSLSYFFGQLTLSINAFNCPATSQFILSKIDKLLTLFYLYPCPFFTINSDLVEMFILHLLKTQQVTFQMINFVMSSVSPLGRSFTFPAIDATSIIMPFIEQKKIANITTIFDFCHRYMCPETMIKLFKIPELPFDLRSSYSWLFKYLSNDDFKELFTIDQIKSLIHTSDYSFHNAIYRAVEGLLDDNETVSNRCTFIMQTKKDVFSIGEDFLFSSHLAFKGTNEYNIDFIKGLYRVYEDSFVDYSNHILIERMSFIPLNKNSDFSNILLNELIKDAIETNSWKMFSLLKSIANSHLFLFNNDDTENPIDLISIFKYCIESINYINSDNLNDQFRLFLACHAFLSFLVLSPCIADAFFNWIFSRFNEFNDNDFYYVLTFINSFLTNHVTEIQMLAFCVKYNFVSSMIKFLQSLNQSDENPPNPPQLATMPLTDAATTTAASSTASVTTTTTAAAAATTTEPSQRSNQSIDFTDQMLYIDYELFTVSDSDDNNNNDHESDENIDSYIGSIQLGENENDNSNDANSNSKPKRSESNERLNIEGIMRSSERMKKESYSLGLSIIGVVQSIISSFYEKSNVLKLIKFDETLKNTSLSQLYRGSYNDCWNFSSFKPFSNSFPRNISFPHFEPKPFSKYLVNLKSSLVNIDLVESLIQNKILGDIDIKETTIMISRLRDPYQKEQPNFNAPVEPKENFSSLSCPFPSNGNINSSSSSNGDNSSSFIQWGGPVENGSNKYGTSSLLLKDIISIDLDEYDFLDESGQAAILRQNLPSLPDVNDPSVYRLLLKMPTWAYTILSNSPDRAILPPCYLIELHRIVSIINRSQKKSKCRKNSKNNNENNEYKIDFNPTQLLFEVETKDGLIEEKLDFISNLRKNKSTTPLKSIKKACEVLLKDSTLYSEEISKKVFSLGIDYLSINSNIETVTCILCAFESMKQSKFFVASFSPLSLPIYEIIGRSSILNPEIAVLACSLYSGLGNSISEIGIQFFEICLQMDDPMIYECLDYLAQLPEKAGQELTKYICNLIENKQLLENLGKDMQSCNSSSSTATAAAASAAASLDKSGDNGDKSTLSLIEKIVKNFPIIVKIKYDRFIEILEFILSKEKYLPVVGQIASILCPPKIPQNKLRPSPSVSAQASSTPSSTPSSSSLISPAPTPPALGMLPTPKIIGTASLNSFAAQRFPFQQQISMQPPPLLLQPPPLPPQMMMQQAQAMQQGQNLFDGIPLSISLNRNDEDEYGLTFGVPNHIFKTSPKFWKVIGPSMPLFNRMIEKDLKALQYELSFLKSYPEVLSFNCKLLLFHKIQCIQQMRQQKQLQREYHKRGGILSFNSVIMTINNSNNNNSNNNNARNPNSTTANNVSFINSGSNQPGQQRGQMSRANSSMVSFEQARPFSAQPGFSLQSQNAQAIISIPPTSRVPQRSNTTSSVANNNENENEDGRSNTNSINGGIIRPMIKINRSRVLADTYNVFGPAFNKVGSIMPVRDIFVRFTGEPGIDLGGLTKDWISSTIKELFNQDYYLFKQTTDGFSLFPNASSFVNPEHLGYFELAGRIIAISIAKDINIDAHLALPFLKSLLEKKSNIKDLEKIESQVFNSLEWLRVNENVEELDMYFVVDVERTLGIKETVDLIKNGRNIKVTDANKELFIAYMANYYLHSSVELQIEAFKKGFYSIIPLNLIEMFTPTELDLLISGTNKIDIDDMRKNCSYEKPYHKDHPVISLFFNCISKWDQEELHLLLRFITGLSHVPVGGFASMAERKKPLTISPGGDRKRLPQAHTCFNRIDIPAYQNEKELNEKLRLSIHECDNFLLI